MPNAIKYYLEYHLGWGNDCIRLKKKNKKNKQTKTNKKKNNKQTNKQTKKKQQHLLQKISSLKILSIVPIGFIHTWLQGIII